MHNCVMHFFKILHILHIFAKWHNCLFGCFAFCMYFLHVNLSLIRYPNQQGSSHSGLAKDEASSLLLCLPLKLCSVLFQPGKMNRTALSL